jgi:hypothetical protein
MWILSCTGWIPCCTLSICRFLFPNCLRTSTDFSDQLKDHLTIKGPFPEAEEDHHYHRNFEAGSIPSLRCLYWELIPTISRQPSPSLNPKLPGGETTALTLLDNYIQTYIRGTQRFETSDPLTDTRSVRLAVAGMHFCQVHL